MDHFISSSEAAHRLGYTVQHIRRLIKQGDLKGAKIGRDWVVEAPSVDGLLLRRENLDLPLTPKE
jgi:excisionase family DNA binding protein